MAKVGRPTKYRKEYCELLIEHMAQGLSFESFAAVVGTWKDILYDWTKRYEDFSTAKKKGTELSRLWWEQKAMQHITHTREGRQLNSVVWIFNMKNRFGWRNQDEEKVDTSQEESYPDPTKSDS